MGIAEILPFLLLNFCSGRSARRSRFLFELLPLPLQKRLDITRPMIGRTPKLAGTRLHRELSDGVNPIVKLPGTYVQYSGLERINPRSQGVGFAPAGPQQTAAGKKRTAHS